MSYTRITISPEAIMMSLITKGLIISVILYISILSTFSQALSSEVAPLDSNKNIANIYNLNPNKPNRYISKNYSEFYTYFRVSSTTLDMSYKNNRQQYESLSFFMNKLLSSSNNFIDSVIVYGSASPEGNANLNALLSRQRCDALKNYFTTNFPTIDQSRILTYSKGEDWSGLSDLVIKDAKVPYRDEVLSILSVSSDRQNKEYFLRKLHGGVSWSYISTHLLPLLRGGAASIKIYSNYSYADDPDITPKVETVVLPARFEVAPVINISTPVIERMTSYNKIDTIFLKSDTVRIVERIRDTLRLTNIIESPVVTNRPMWAVKTNLLYWAALQPNIEAEFYFGKHWSLNFEYQVAWWKNAAKHQYYQYMQCGPEGRYWFKGDNNFKGHYIGLHVGFGLYDLSWGETADNQGYQGEFAIALGLSYGYVWKVGSKLYLEAGLGFGYIMTEYRRYRYIDQCYVYQATERMQFVGPTKARLTLQWRFGMNGNNTKKGGKR